MFFRPCSDVFFSLILTNRFRSLKVNSLENIFCKFTLLTCRAPDVLLIDLCFVIGLALNTLNKKEDAQ